VSHAVAYGGIVCSVSCLAFKPTSDVEDGAEEGGEERVVVIVIVVTMVTVEMGRVVVIARAEEQSERARDAWAGPRNVPMVGGNFELIL